MLNREASGIDMQSNETPKNYKYMKQKCKPLQTEAWQLSFLNEIWSSFNDSALYSVETSLRDGGERKR